MKKYFLLLSVTILFTCAGFSQSLQATIVPGSIPSSIYIKVKSKGIGTSPAVPISTVNFCIQVSSSIATKPTLSVNEILPATGVGTYTIDDVSSEAASLGYYTWNIIGNDGTTVTSWMADEELTFIEVFFNGAPNVTTDVRMVHLPDGGATGASTFYLSIGGVAQIIENELMYGVTSLNNTSGLYPLGNAVVTLPNIVLPVKISGFNVSKKNNAAELNWSVENETADVSSYEILRGSNGIDFKTVANVSPKKNGQSKNTYQLIDNELSVIRSNSGVIYYRIKQVDKDGQFVFTEVKSIRLDGKAFAVGVYPNPIKNIANISIDLVEDANLAITITDAAGRQVRRSQVQAFKGLNTKKIDMSSYPAGNYLLKVNSGAEVKTISLIKTH